MAKQRLSQKEAEFIRLYVSGPQGLRGNATECYKAAKYSTKGNYMRNAAVGSHRLLQSPKIQREIERLHRQADMEVIAQLEDWKKYAPQAQARYRTIMLGYLPGDNDLRGQPTLRRMQTRDDAAVAKVILDAAAKIMERAYPSKVYDMILLQDPAKLLSELLGVSRSELPAIESEFHGTGPVVEA